MTARGWLGAWLPVVGWIALIAWLSGDGFSDDRTAAWLTRWPLLAALLPPDWIDPVNLILRKSAHFVEYAILSLLTWRALGISMPDRPPRVRFAAALAVALSCAVFDEVHQLTTLTRSGSPYDLVFDAGGAAAGALLGSWRQRRRGPRTP